jgi:lysyl-tRNA synthetase class 2
MLLDRNEIINNRYRKVDDMRKEGIEPYPRKFEPTHLSGDILANPDSFIESGEDVRVAGRIMTMRKFGKAAFFHIQDDGGRIQIHVRKGETPDEYIDLFKKYVDGGDIVGVEGTVFRTKTEEVTVLVKRLVMLSKAVRPLPEKWHGLRDREQRYRQRYVDLFANEDVLATFKARTDIINSMRVFLNDKGYVEVETPMMQPIYGGALARPFVTHHNTLDMRLYLRIAPELYLKRLVVGGMHKVYEINRNFRNEGISTVHNPEFTMLELYTAYWDYNDTLNLVEQLLKDACQQLHGKLTFPYGEIEIDFNGEWKRLTILEAIKETLGLDADWNMPADDARAIVLDNVADIKKEEIKDWNSDQLIMLLFESRVEDKLIQPVFITEFPKSASPLAKAKEANPAVAERFELFICGMEVANAYTELNDPAEQYDIFGEQVKRRQAGDDEACMMDEDYIRALEYGMPPTSGLGIGIDRVVMLLTDSHSIRDVILFPHLRPEQEQAEEETGEASSGDKD